MNKAAFYQSHLNRVSRSFAFCIEQLRTPLKEWIGLSYLLCRIIDTVEDSTWENKETQLKSIEKFQSFLKTQPSNEEIQTWAQSFPEVPEREALLLNDAHTMIQDFHELPEGPREVIGETVITMSKGMGYFIERSRNEALRLDSLTDVNRYCFFVAGIVGELLTRLLPHAGVEIEITEELLQKSHQFGLFLQKVNLLKDQAGDEKVGRFLVPKREILLADLEGNAQEAIDYIKAIPVEEKSYRLFCSWSLFLGLASLPWIEKAWVAKNLEKIPRVVTQKILDKVTDVIDSNEKLQKIFAEMKPRFDQFTKNLEELKDDSCEWLNTFKRLYPADLPRKHWHRLGMIRG